MHDNKESAGRQEHACKWYWGKHILHGGRLKGNDISNYKKSTKLNLTEQLLCARYYLDQEFSEARLHSYTQVFLLPLPYFPISTLNQYLVIIIC